MNHPVDILKPKESSEENPLKQATEYISENVAETSENVPESSEIVSESSEKDDLNENIWPYV